MAIIAKRTAPAPRLSLASLRVLRLMANDPGRKQYCYGIANALSLKPDYVYRVLSSLESYGWIEGKLEHVNTNLSARPRRRLYLLTDLGKTESASALQMIQTST